MTTRERWFWYVLGDVVLVVPLHWIDLPGRYTHLVYAVLVGLFVGAIVARFDDRRSS